MEVSQKVADNMPECAFTYVVRREKCTTTIRWRCRIKTNLARKKQEIVYGMHSSLVVS